MQEAFKDINQNFLELGIVLSNSLDLDPLSFENFNSNIIPSETGNFNLGSASKTWKSLYISPSFDPVVPGSEFNGIWLGSAQIKGFGSNIDLPAGSTVNGNLIIDADKTFFKTFKIPGQADVVADQFNDEINLTFSSGVAINTDANSKTINLVNTGVTSVNGSSHIQVSANTGDVTITNLGVTDLSAGAGINLSQSTGSVSITNTGILGIVSGGGGIAIDVTNGQATVTNTRADTLSFRTIQVPGQNDLTADTPSDTLRIVADYGIDITTSEPLGLSETLTIAFNNNVDIIGSVFADNSTTLVDGTNGTIPGTLTGSWISPGNSFDIIGDGLSVSTQNTALTISNNGLTYANSLNDETTAINISNGNVTLSMSGNITVSAQGSVAIASGPLSAAVNGAITIANDGNVSWAANGDFVVAANNININSGGISANTFTGDVKGSVFADNSTMLIDSTNGVIFAENIAGTFTGNVVGNVTGNTTGYHTGDVTGSIFADNSTLLINGIDGTVAYYATTASDWDGDAPTTMGEAIDRLAALIKTLNSGTGA
jgi:hypothetical protein